MGVLYPLCQDCTIIGEQAWCENKSIHKKNDKGDWGKQNT